MFWPHFFRRNLINMGHQAPANLWQSLVTNQPSVELRARPSWRKKQERSKHQHQNSIMACASIINAMEVGKMLSTM